MRYGISILNCETWYYRTPSEGTVRLPGNGAVTTISGEFTPEEVGSKTIRSGFISSTMVSLIQLLYQK